MERTTDLSTVIVTILYVDETENVQKKNCDSQNIHSKNPANPLLSITSSSLLNNDKNRNAKGNYKIKNTLKID